MPVASNLHAFSHDSNARYKAMKRLEEKIKDLSDAPQTEERQAVIDAFKAKLAALKSQG